MPFVLIDRIVEIDPNQRIIASKTLAPDEEYLRDHFPRFPVMPGVLMLEALYQAAGWLVRVKDGFRQSLVLLHQARNVRYSGFVVPGNVLTVHVDWERANDIRGGSSDELNFRGRGEVNGVTVVTAKLSLLSRSLAEQDRRLAALDRDICCQKKQEFFALRSAGNNGAELVTENVQ